MAGLATAIGGGCGAITVAIDQQWFPPWCQQALRDWLMHGTAVAATAILAGLLLGVTAEATGSSRRFWLAVCIPFLLLGLHELMQWLYPASTRDPFDSWRDVALNGLGTTLAAGVLHHCRARTPPPD
jgi:hypothetical protein